MSVFSLIQSQVTDQLPPVYNDVVFVIDTSSSLSPSFSYLLDEYIEKIIRYFTGFIGEPKVFYESKEAYTQFGIVLVVPTATPTVPLVKKLQATSSTGLVLEYLRSLVFEGAGFEYFSLSDGLVGAIDIFRNLQNHQDLRPGSHEKYCVVVTNKPHHTLPYSRGSEFNGSTALDITSYMKKQQIKLSVVSPRRIPELKSLYEQALLSPDLSIMDANKQYKHLVMLQGIDMQGKGDQMNTVTAEEQPTLHHTDLTDPTVFTSYAQIQHPNANTMQIRDQHTMQQQMHIRNNQNLQPGLAPYPQLFPQPPYHEPQLPPQQQPQQQPQPLTQPQIQQQQQQPFQQCPSPLTFIKSSPKTSPSMANLNIPSPNISNSNTTETNEPPSKKVCIDDPPHSPSKIQGVVPPIDIKSEIDIKPNISSLNPSFSMSSQLMPDVKPNIDEFESKPVIHPNLGGISSSPPHLDPSKPVYPQGMMPMPGNLANAPPSQGALQSQPIDIILEEISRAPMGGGYCSVKGRVTFQHQCLIPEGFPKKWSFKTSPPIVYLREILFSQSDPNQFGNNDRGLIYGSMQILDNPNRLPCLQSLTENKMCLFLYHHRVQTTNFQINFQMLIVKLNERVSKSTLTVLYPVDKRFYQRFSEVMKKGHQHKQPIPRMPGMMPRGMHGGLGLEQLASNQMSSNPMQSGMGGNMGMMPGMNQMGNNPGGYNSMMGGMGSSAQNSGNMMNAMAIGNNNNGNGQGNDSASVSAPSDTSGATAVSTGGQMSSSNDLMMSNFSNIVGSSNPAMMSNTNSSMVVSSASSTMMSSANSGMTSSGGNGGITSSGGTSDLMGSVGNSGIVSSSASGMVSSGGNSDMMSSGANIGMMGSGANSGMMSNVANSGMMSNVANSGMMSNVANSGMMSSSANSGMMSSSANNGMMSNVANSGMMSSGANSGNVIPNNPMSNNGNSTAMSSANSANNPMMSNTTTSMGMGGGLLPNNPAYPVNNPGGVTRSQVGDQSGFNQTGGTQSSVNNSLALLLNDKDVTRPNLRPQMGIRTTRPQTSQQMMSQIGNQRGMMMQQRYAHQARRPMMPNQQMMGGQSMMMSGMENPMMMGMGSQGMGQMGQDRMQIMPGMSQPQGGMLPNPGMQKQDPMQHFMKN